MLPMQVLTRYASDANSAPSTTYRGSRRGERV